MQTSQVFSQRDWPLHGGSSDIDDCWVVSALQATHCVLPWVALPTVRGFRAAAGDPDDGQNDGGNVKEIMAGLKGVWPQLVGHLEPLRGAGWAYVVAELEKGRPLTVAVVSSDLPARLRYGFDGFHQVTLAVKPGGVRFANPLAPPHSRWDELGGLATVRDAIMGYGRAKAGEPGAWGVLLPTEAEAFLLHPLYQGCDAARAEGYAEAKRAAMRVVGAI